MGSLGQTFSRDTMPESTSFSPIPQGDYLLTIEKAEVKRTNRGDGQFIALTLSVAQGDFANRKVFENINFDNPNQTAVEIGLQQLNKLCECGNLPQISDSDQLVGIMCGATISIEISDRGDRNVVKYFKLPTEVQSSPTKAGQRQQQPTGGMPTPPAPQQPAMGFGGQPTAPTPPQYQAPQAPAYQQPAQYQTPPQQPAQYQAPNSQVNPQAQHMANQLDDDIPFG